MKEVRHIVFSVMTPGQLQACCEQQEQAGYALERLVPFSAYECVAVFSK